MAQEVCLCGSDAAVSTAGRWADPAAGNVAFDA
jgi:hypothetical protein